MNDILLSIAILSTAGMVASTWKFLAIKRNERVWNGLIDGLEKTIVCLRSQLDSVRSMKFLTPEADAASNTCRTYLQDAIMLIQRRKMGHLLPAVLGENADGTTNESDVITPAETQEELDEKIRMAIEHAKAANDRMRKEMQL